MYVEWKIPPSQLLFFHLVLLLSCTKSDSCLPSPTEAILDFFQPMEQNMFSTQKAKDIVFQNFSLNKSVYNINSLGLIDFLCDR